MLEHAPLGIYLHDSRLGQPVHIGIEGADTVGQALRQHGHNAVGHIDRGRPIEGFLVQLRAFFDIVGHICDMDAQLKVAIFQTLDMDSIVQVLGIRSIDGKGNLIAQVQTSFQITLCRCIWNSLGLFQDLFWKLGDNIHGLQHFQYINARVVDMTDHINQTRHKEIVFLGRIFVNSNLEYFCAIQNQGWLFDINRLTDLLIFRADIARILRLFLIQNQLANCGGQAMFQNINNLSLS